MEEKSGEGKSNRLRIIAVVVALIVLGGSYLAFVAIPNAMQEARWKCTLNNGGQLITAMFYYGSSGHTDSTWIVQATLNWPKTGTSDRWPDACHYFGEMVTNNYLDVGYGFFTACGAGMSAVGTFEEFVDGGFHNFWCVTLDAELAGPNVPVLFSQNFSFSSNTLSSCTGMNPKARPWGDKGGLVVLRNGAGLIVRNQKDAIAVFKDATNSFLWAVGQKQFVAH